MKRKSTKLMAIIICAIMLAALLPTGAFAAEVTVSNEVQLSDAINSASGPTTIIVSQDFAITEAIFFPRDKDITIKSQNGNSFTLTTMPASIYRNWHFSVGLGSSLTLENITLDGGYTGNGVVRGGLSIGSYGSVTLNSGAMITNGYGTEGAVYNDGGTFTINGGAIIGNTSTRNGGGVDNRSGGTVIINGGEISGNTAELYGGGIYSEGNSTVNIFGGIISGNTAGNGGGVAVYGRSVVNIYGGVIENNEPDDILAINGGTVNCFVPANYTVLDAALAAAAELKKADYTAASWDVLATAVADGEAVDRNLTVLDQNLIDDAAAVILSAIDGLVPAEKGPEKPMKDKLNDAIANGDYYGTGPITVIVDGVEYVFVSNSGNYNGNGTLFCTIDGVEYKLDRNAHGIKGVKT